MTFTYTPAEESAWLALKPMLATAQGQLNPDLAREYIRAANAGLPSYDTSRDYSGRLLALTVLLKKHPEYIPDVLPTLYRACYETESVRQMLTQMEPSQLVPTLIQLFGSEKELGTQVALMMDIGRYGRSQDVEQLNLSKLLKVKPERLLKALSPTASTWDDFMVLAGKLRNQPETTELAHQIALSVGLQIALDKSLPRHEACQQYNWLEVARRWKKHDWEWDPVDVLTRARGRVKGMTLGSDLLVSFALPGHPVPDKAALLLKRMADDTSWMSDVLDRGENSAMRVYMTTSERHVQLACLEYFNARGPECRILEHGWRQTTPQELALTTQKLVDDVLLPEGWTQAKVLSHDRAKDGSLPCAVLSNTALFRALLFSKLPMGDMDLACRTIANRWMHEFNKDLGSSHDYRHPLIEETLSALGTPMPEETRSAIRASTGFKQLLLYSAYMYAQNPDWTKYVYDFMPNVEKKPLGMLPLMYPEHNAVWAGIQSQVLAGKTNFEDAFGILAKVLFDKELSFSQLRALKDTIGSSAEDIIATLIAPQDELILDQVDFGAFQIT